MRNVSLILIVKINQNEYIRNVSCVSRCQILLKRYVYNCFGCFFLMDSYGLLISWISYGFLWICYGFFMNTQCISYEFRMDFHMISEDFIDFLWNFYGFPIGFLLISYGFPMDFLWISYGFLFDCLWFLFYL